MSSDLIKFPKIVILLLLCTFASFMGILFTPALPELAKDFGLSQAVALRTMSIFLIGYAIGQLPYGPIANRFGRKGAITIGAAIAFCGTILAFFSTAFWVLCLARFIQAIGSSVGLKIAFTMIGDLHAGESAAKGVANLAISFGFIPGLAAAIGGFVTVWAGWRGCFLLLSVYVILLWLLSRILPETAHELHRDALQLKKISHGYMQQFRNAYVILHAFLAGLTTASIYIFVTLSPYIGIERIGLTPDTFGLWALVPSLGLFVGAVFSRKLSAKKPRIAILSGIFIFLFAIASLSVLFAEGIIVPWSLFIPAFFFYMGSNLIWTQALASGLSSAADKSNASAVMQFINMGTATVGVLLVGAVPPTTTMLLPAAFGLILLLLFAVWFTLKAPIYKQ